MWIISGSLVGLWVFLRVHLHSSPFSGKNDIEFETLWEVQAFAKKSTLPHANFDKKSKFYNPIFLAQWIVCNLRSSVIRLRFLGSQQGKNRHRSKTAQKWPENVDYFGSEVPLAFFKSLPVFLVSLRKKFSFQLNIA